MSKPKSSMKASAKQLERSDSVMPPRLVRAPQLWALPGTSRGNTKRLQSFCSRRLVELSRKQNTGTGRKQALSTSTQEPKTGQGAYIFVPTCQY